MGFGGVIGYLQGARRRRGDRVPARVRCGGRAAWPEGQPEPARRRRSGRSATRGPRGGGARSAPGLAVRADFSYVLLRESVRYVPYGLTRQLDQSVNLRYCKCTTCMFFNSSSPNITPGVRWPWPKRFILETKTSSPNTTSGRLRISTMYSARHIDAADGG